MISVHSSVLGQTRVDYAKQKKKGEIEQFFPPQIMVKRMRKVIGNYVFNK